MVYVCVWDPCSSQSWSVCSGATVSPQGTSLLYGISAPCGASSLCGALSPCGTSSEPCRLLAPCREFSPCGSLSPCGVSSLQETVWSIVTPRGTVTLWGIITCGTSVTVQGISTLWGIVTPCSTVTLRGRNCCPQGIVTVCQPLCSLPALCSSLVLCLHRDTMALCGSACLGTGTSSAFSACLRTWASPGSSGTRSLSPARGQHP